ncbi:hypothetical protein TVAG_361570 [Trichomonas vaginalis G3]|uniref:E2F/DP family winged-helix DNA-binding domain-containing protein n=1 Tax=Trichomonas vaginalis (strain ATCC PRA-98 / G3) TaxID=412133 RepID=A2FQN4_TRIV3|nr:winged helix DNA-binding domain family [Trichomonas vaginalis G3]EAX92777.1 hypothetical protein TVAG_361570 [Trichomonas vaginalis G3]KAI5524683.1 winged helix DNA-binding domain family [Trichomonas vaginalis G3]|eukprot:XP_001305707.1 hypothetical protein [Trichomonas vaginalis G3]
MTTSFNIESYFLTVYGCQNHYKVPSEPKSKIDGHKQRDCFHNSISKFLDYCNSNGEVSIKITDVCDKFGFQRRRFYDLASILQAFGILEKSNMDTVKWVGMERIIPTLENIIIERGLKYFNKSNVSDFFPSEQKLLMHSIGINFVLLFISLRRQQLNMQETASFFARDNGRFKSTLCKLYQVVYLLVELGIVERRKTPSEVFLADKYFNYFCKKPIKQPFPIPITIKQGTQLPISCQLQPSDPIDSIFKIDTSFDFDIDQELVFSS